MAKRHVQLNELSILRCLELRGSEVEESGQLLHHLLVYNVGNEVQHREVGLGVGLNSYQADAAFAVSHVVLLRKQIS